MEGQVNFEDVIAEPAGLHSPNRVWKASYSTFTVSMYLCYCCMTSILSVPLSLIWGLLFACMSFCHIWTFVPCIKCLSRCHMLVIRKFTSPVFEALGKIYSGMRLIFRKEA
ncbi:caveolin-3-like [Toxotes jaculatrix]|uniref:caveolin-3-like n=1 Tax=Toxotes jaculatrix TaxID=941984 RepID=UPI001B3AB793|nr:caveolin-3-like [Toxotes jaculatrix]